MTINVVTYIRDVVCNQELCAYQLPLLYNISKGYDNYSNTLFVRYKPNTSCFALFSGSLLFHKFSNKKKTEIST